MNHAIVTAIVIAVANTVGRKKTYSEATRLVLNSSRSCLLTIKPMEQQPSRPSCISNSMSSSMHLKVPCLRQPLNTVPMYRHWLMYKTGDVDLWCETKKTRARRSRFRALSRCNFGLHLCHSLSFVILDALHRADATMPLPDRIELMKVHSCSFGPC